MFTHQMGTLGTMDMEDRLRTYCELLVAANREITRLKDEAAGYQQKLKVETDALHRATQTLLVWREATDSTLEKKVELLEKVADDLTQHNYNAMVRALTAELELERQQDCPKAFEELMTAYDARRDELEASRAEREEAVKVASICADTSAMGRAISERAEALAREQTATDWANTYKAQAQRLIEKNKELEERLAESRKTPMEHLRAALVAVDYVDIAGNIQDKGVERFATVRFCAGQKYDIHVSLMGGNFANNMPPGGFPLGYRHPRHTCLLATMRPKPIKVETSAPLKTEEEGIY